MWERGSNPDLEKVLLTELADTHILVLLDE